MGRLPSEWADRPIRTRIPYEFAAEQVLAGSQTSQQFPDAVFTHGVDKPFEIHRLVPRVTALNNAGNPVSPQPDQELLLQLVRTNILDFGKNERLTKSSTLLSLLTKGTSERTWEWAEPYYLVRSEGFQVSLDTLSLATLAGDGVTQLRIGMCFQGFLLVVAPPSNNR